MGGIANLQSFGLLYAGNAFCEVKMKERPKKKRKKKCLVSCWDRRKINSLKENFLENNFHLLLLFHSLRDHVECC